MIENILKYWKRAIDNNRVDASIGWYTQAKLECIKLGEKYNVSTEIIVAMVAALCPRLRWDVNIDAAEKVFLDLPSRAFKTNRIKAKRILETGDISILSGIKVTSFFTNIIDPQNNEAVTIDVWAMRVWSNEFNQKGISDKQYWKIASDYREAAKIVGVLPSEIQAVTWVECRDFGMIENLDIA